MAEVEENWQDFYSASARVMTRSLIRELLKLTRRGNIISFAGGLPDPATFPVEEIKAITAGLLEREANLVLQYGPTEGDARLRDELVKWMAKDGIHVSRVVFRGRTTTPAGGAGPGGPRHLPVHLQQDPVSWAAHRVDRGVCGVHRAVCHRQAGHGPVLSGVDAGHCGGVLCRRSSVQQGRRDCGTISSQARHDADRAGEGDAPRRDLDPSPGRLVSLGAAAGRHGHGTIVAAGSRRRRRLCGGGGVSRRRRRARRYAAELLISLGAGDRGRRPTPCADRQEASTRDSKSEITETGNG